VHDELVRQRLDGVDDDRGAEGRIARRDVRMRAQELLDERDDARLDVPESLPDVARERRLLEQHAMERPVALVERHHPFHEVADHLLEVVAATRHGVGAGALEDRFALGQVRLHERDEQRVLAREVLVE
jgi:hypothetical protein